MKKVKTKLFYEITSKVKETVKAFDQNTEVILFGSRARGDYKKDSDWDFLILTELSVNDNLKNCIRENIYDAELATDQCFASIVKNKNDWENNIITDLYKNIVDEGIRV